MSDLTELNMIQLKKFVRVAALPAESQIAFFPKGVVVADEIGLVFGGYCQWALRGHEAPDLTSEQQASLIALDTRLCQMAALPDADLSTEVALRTRPEWEEVRRDARKILNAFGWSMDDK